MLKKILSVTFLFIICYSSFSQKEILVELIDAETNEPISFATVAFKETNRGLVADYDGQFRLPYIEINNLPDIIITALGYTSIEINPRVLKIGKLNVIKMFPQAESLDAVILNVTNNNKQKSLGLNNLIKKNRKILGKEIVEKAINLIPSNLNESPSSVIGYYRDYQLVNDEYFNLNEGILEQFDAGISTSKIENAKNQNAFYSLKTNAEFKTSKRYSKKYDGESKYVENAELLSFGGNELSILNVHNPIRNYNKNSFSYVYQLNKDFIKNHEFSKEGFTFDKENPIVNISFTTLTNQGKGVQQRVLGAKKIEKLKVEGHISISLKDYAIHGFTYTMYDFKQRNPLFNVKIEYKHFKGKMYLNYISFNNRFVVGEDFIFKDESVTYNQEEECFNVYFNNKLGTNTIKRRNFKIRLKDRKVLVKSVKVMSPKHVKIQINDFDKSMAELFDKDMSDLSFEIKGVKDIDGRSIYKSRTVTGYQFREFFTQEIFQSKTLNNNLKFAPKGQPLQVTQVNELLNTIPYIINSPLQKRRMNSEK
ncbi:carboxypeptidase-like regulatory domain-containing protein [uncultured Winogradskyella sp.]|uniref:carboxypeptidase-like regulatory domain-containing protein n=1 Tax=uncultured Winogradskyella sp. TaxID=395353 RepID=UPI0026242870|nr:carboxypeptidase-like regulatory domain-containing protein [uncultured Winogradskyella sp.]